MILSFLKPDLLCIHTIYPDILVATETFLPLPNLQYLVFNFCQFHLSSLSDLCIFLFIHHGPSLTSSYCNSFPSCYPALLHPRPQNHASQNHHGNLKLKTQIVILLLRFHLFIIFREGKGGRKRGNTHWCMSQTSIGCLLYAPCWGVGSQPRHVPWWGIELATLWFTGQHSVHWATLAGAHLVIFLLKILQWLLIV